ncbi:MFS transporter [Tsukamurella ocularis]|uniref:MFS transporter n=1 Tax=Tsukamurella ocularis TaxID=1970234 RepID=UPI00216814D8|nr:MFS transporter [Tsukamurella ocularis]MCS3780020.1 putative MFS family arabinose efflux permease [Tsukamurella ocularis]MCS3788580.1 putative MFS family arabinose efflux permease [Tsukamurella ocularis]MCS3849790.1 putative MFS family arabinose efflux permease [Tsukamurella ocularis]
MSSIETREELDAATLIRLAILACATFIYVTFEVFPVGLISEIARDLGQPESRIGLLVSGYAVVAAIVTIPSVAFAARISRGTALVASLVVLVIAELLTSVAVNYPMMVTSRVVAALTHGVLWSLVAPAAAALVPPKKVGVATAIVFGGPALAAILGSPGTALTGGLVGWRNTALILAIATIAITVGVAWAVRPRPAASAPSVRVAGTGAPAASIAQWNVVAVLCVLTLVLVSAHFVSFTYFALIVDQVTRSGGTVLFLAVFGVAGAIGTVLVGRYTDRSPRGTAITAFAVFLTGAVLLVVGQAGGPTTVRYAVLVCAVVAWGAAYAAIGPVLQSGVIRASAADADRASSVYVTCYQVGIAGGSAVGAAILDRSITALPWITAGLATAALAYALSSRARSTFP